MGDMGGSQNYDPFLGTLNLRCRIIIGTQKGTIILTTTHIGFGAHRAHWWPDFMVWALVVHLSYSAM